MSNEFILLVQHQPETDPPQFRVVRQSDGKATDPVPVTAPADVSVAGRPQSDLAQELQWYLEEFLNYPFPPETDHAEQVLAALRVWGTQAFEALFGDRESGRLFDQSTAKGYERLYLQIAADDPLVLAWPWEAMVDPQGGTLAQLCRIERRLNHIRDPYPLPDTLPNDRVNILLVTCRPYPEDVRYRSISRPLVELVISERLPAQVTVLRPPTFDNLRAHLQDRPGYYHILHFDGHGGYGVASSAGDLHRLSAVEGRLVFEDEQGHPDEKTAQQLATLLREHRLPAVVLNACQSAAIDGRAGDAFASVAAALLKAGVRSVTAMAYSLYVSAARQFLPAFYRELFRTGSLAEATRAGRGQLLAHRERVCIRGEFPLEDWLVPVLYQQDRFDLSFAAQGQTVAAPDQAKLPEDARANENPYGLIGRDSTLLQLERALHRPPAGLLVHGLGGVGKTTLSRGFAQWLLETEGLTGPERVVWLRFDSGIRTAEYVVNRMGEPLFGSQFAASPLPERLDKLAAALREHRYLIVWDNFEGVCGIEGTEVAAKFSTADRDILRNLLGRLRGGQTKVLMTSRSPEDWLPADCCWRLPLGGLDGEERWEYCGVLLSDLGLTVDRNDKELANLLNDLEGHPLAMRVVLTELGRRSAAQVRQQMQTNLDDLELTADATERKLFATLRFVEDDLPPDLRPLLIPLAHHERFVEPELLEFMAQQIGPEWTRERIDRFLQILAAGGLAHYHKQVVYELHPLLTRFLRARGLHRADEKKWSRAFVDIMGDRAKALVPRPLLEQRRVFFVHGSNFHNARTEAQRLELWDSVASLTQWLAVFAQNLRDFVGAQGLFTQLFGFSKQRGDERTIAIACHHLGMIAQENCDFAAAEQWFHKSRESSERLGIEHATAITHHHLGMVAEQQHDFAAAEQWYHKSLEINERLGKDLEVATTYRQLGTLAHEQRDFSAAEQWFRKSLEISERLADEHASAFTYHELGIIAHEKGDFAAAEPMYRKSLEIKERLGDEHSAASTYYELGRIVQEQRDFAAAERSYHKSLEISERLGDEQGMARNYRWLGRVTQEKHDFAAAKQWYHKSLEVTEMLGDEDGTAMIYHQLGIMSEDQQDFANAEVWYHKSREISERLGDEHGAASSYGQLGIVAWLQGHDLDSGRWLIKSIESFIRTGDPDGAERNSHTFAMLYGTASSADRQELAHLWEEADIGPLPEPPT